MDRPPLEVADLVRAAGDAFIERSRKWITWKHVKVLLAMARCRTAALGGHLDECTRCGHRAISYNSCGNRHCSKLPAIPNILAQKLASSACCTPGVRNSKFTHMCIAWCQPVDFLPIARVGSSHATRSFFLSKCPAESFAASSVRHSNALFKRAD